MTASRQARLDNHLSNTLATKRLASDKVLLLQSCKGIATSSQSQNNGCGDQTTCVNDNAEVLYQRHYAVNSCSHVVGCEAADKGVELGGCRTNSEEERNLNEYEDERGDTVDDC